MAGLKESIRRLATSVEESFDAAALSFRRRLKLTEPLQIVTYRSYGTLNQIYVKGRVLEDKFLQKPTANDTILKNILAMYRRFESDEVPGATLQLNFGNQVYNLVTDQEGFFVLRLQTENPLVHQGQWYEVNIDLLQAPVKYSGKVSAVAEVLVPDPEAEYGIISDIDDTIVRTGATDLIAMSRNTFFHNAHSRLPFAGVSEFYKSLQLGRNGKRNNPFFYVSSSPWNLYDLLIDFMDLNEIPPGPLLLRDFGLDRQRAGASDHMGHKFKEIKQILDAYPNLNFVLIGDSGQEDPKIYREVVKKFPGRILAVYIRDVQLPDRERIAVEISKDLSADSVEMVIVDNTVEAADHAARIGLIYTEALPEIVEDKKRDKGEIPGKQKIE